MSEDVINEMGFELKSENSKQTETAISGQQPQNKTALINEEENAKQNNSPEKTLETIATVILCLGILASVVMLFTICFIQNPKYSYVEEKIFNPSGFGITCGTLLSSLATWASMKVLANISLTLKDIWNKIK